MVVVSIIAILVAILIPAVSTFHQQVQTAKCMSNLQQIGLGIRTYAQDHENYLVPGDYWGQGDGGPPPYGYPVKNGSSSWEIILVDGGYLPAPGGVQTSAIQHQAGFNGDYFRDNVFMCPSGMQEDGADYGWPTTQTDPRGTMFVARAEDSPPQTSILSWYAFNGGVAEVWEGPPLPFKFLPDVKLDPQQGWIEDWSLRRFSSFNNTSRLPLIYDGFWMYMYNSVNINARHNARMQTNLLFADFHCETQQTSSLPNANWYLQ